MPEVKWYGFIGQYFVKLKRLLSQPIDSNQQLRIEEPEYVQALVTALKLI
ncbi:MAG: hypothetical protein Q4G44_00460 [Alcaligenaceae bacterium]|nr:hypothetical protein [Alcaligenaceae bacterium]